MPEKTTADLLNTLFAELNNIMAPADLSPGAPAPKTFVTAMFPGVTVIPEDYDVRTQEGKKKLYETMNDIPALSKRYTSSHRSCADLFEKILSAQFPPDNSEKAKELEAEFKAAQAIVDDGDVMDKYEEYEDRYIQAKNAYFAAVNKTGLSEAEHEELIRQARDAMNRALDRWNGRGRKSQVDQALAVCARYLAYTPAKVFKDAATAFETAQSGVAGCPVTCLPSTWATDPDSLAWTDVVIKQDSSQSRTHHDVQSLNADISVTFQSGPWHASGSGGYNEKIDQLNKSSSAEHLAISCQVARVELKRDWFTTALLTYSQAVIPGMKAGKLCGGSLAKADQCDFPIIPTAFVVARNITVYNQFSGEELDALTKDTSWYAKASVGYGPFSLSGGAAHSQSLSDEEKKEFGDCVKLTMGQGIQLIGFLNTVLTPAFPGQDWDAHACALTSVQQQGDDAAADGESVMPILQALNGRNVTPM